MAILATIFMIISAVLIFFLVFPFVMVLLSGIFKDRVKPIQKGDAAYKEVDYGCIITAYKNAEIAKPLIESLVSSQKYDNLHVYLVADDCDITGWDVNHAKLTVLNPQPALKLKAKSIIHAIENFVRPHEYIAVFDADNLAHPQFFNVINKYVNNGHRAVQGQRTAKNLDTVYACADATGEFYKNYVDRYLPYVLGSSAVISGSGMAVEAELYKSYLASPEIEQGKTQWKKMLQEDKILQNVLLRENERITYAWDAIVFDEKVVSGEQVETQRSRWLFSYFQNFPNSSGLLLKVYLSKAPKQIWSALWGLPLFVINQFKGLLKMGNPNKNFKHSEHTRKVSIDEVMKQGTHKE